MTAGQIPFAAIARLTNRERPRPRPCRHEAAENRHRRGIHRPASPPGHRPGREDDGRRHSGRRASAICSPNLLGETGRREFRNLLRSFNQELAALNVPAPPRAGLRREPATATRPPPHGDATRLRPRGAAGRCACPKMPDDASTPRGQTLRESLCWLSARTATASGPRWRSKSASIRPRR